MDFDLSKPQRLLQESVRDFCGRECPLTRVRELMATDSAFDESLWEEIAGQGWIGLHLPEDAGGLGLGLVDLAVVAEELGRACLPGPFLPANWAATLLAELGGQSLAKQQLAAVLDGSKIATVALLEDGGCWEACPDSLTTTVSADGKTLSGTKTLVLHAAQANDLLVIAKQKSDLCVVSVPRDSQGVKITPTPGVDATRKLARVEFDNVAIQPEQVLATGETAGRAIAAAQQVATVMVAAEMLGLMQWMLEATVEYAKTRRQFDKPIGVFQAVQHRCADMLLLTESSRSAVWYAAWALQEQKPDAASAVATAKVYASDAARQVGNMAVQAHGGIGFTWEHDLQLFYKRAKADEYLCGDPTFHRERIAELAMDESPAGV